MVRLLVLALAALLIAGCGDGSEDMEYGKWPGAPTDGPRTAASGVLELFRPDGVSGEPGCAPFGLEPCGDAVLRATTDRNGTSLAEEFARNAVSHGYTVGALGTTGPSTCPATHCNLHAWRVIVPDQNTQNDRYLAGVTLTYNTRLWPDHNLEIRAISNGLSRIPTPGEVQEQQKAAETPPAPAS